MTTLASLCKHPVCVVRSGTTIRAAAELMREDHVGALVAVENGADPARPVGILTDRDIVVGIVALGLDPNLFLVEDLLDRPLVVARADQSVEAGLKLMKAQGVRRLPLVDKAGGLVGIVTLDDVLYEVARTVRVVTGILDREITAEVALRHSRNAARQTSATKRRRP